ncbi:MAG: YebC/PmpR family DNA-binding transcriptional regulator [Oscillospiraceae bacterium]|nr:YebC/PmpR family DNA-binding transcriptional regulator [Oscillospiraceae bacterium]
MAGHSKWNNIKHRKGKSDAQRAKIFTKLSREIIVAVREGGGDPSANAKLRDVMAKARAANVPNDNIKRVIDKAAGNQNSTNYESITYEGYGPCGVAVIVETLTDNRVRTVAEVRHAFDKYGGNMGAAGCVAWSFDAKGILIVERDGVDEEALMLAVLDAGAEDIETLGEVYQITTTPERFTIVRDALTNYAFVSAQIEKVPQTTANIDDEKDKAKMQKLLDALEDNDDVQDVWHNWAV